MSNIVGLITNAGLSAAQDASNNEGFNLVPTRFGVSDVAGTLDPNRDQPSSGQFYVAPISSRVVVDQNTLKYTLTIPPNSIPAGTFKIVREVYLYINDASNNEILFAVGQPTEELRLNAADELTLDVEMAIINLNVVENFVFTFTQAQEIAAHNTDPNAHPERIAALRKAGIFVTPGAFPFERRGQHFEDNGGNGVEFDGTKASTILTGGVQFEATFNGTELNTLTISPDGTKTADELRLEFNAANYPNTVELAQGTGTEVLGATTLTLTGGTYIVQDKDIVYKDIDNVYKRAIADGTIKSRVSGIAFIADKCVVTHGLVDINTGFGTSVPIYLSGSVEGGFTNFDTNINLGLSLGDFIYFTGFGGEVNAEVTQQFDAVVTNATGLGQFFTTQEAINAVPQDGRILINKLEDVKDTIDTISKRLTMVVNGPDKGWRRFPGVATEFRLDFDQVPTQGTFRIEWNLQETNDIAFNAVAQDVEDEFNLLNGHNGVTVSGDFTSGFTFLFNDLDNYPLPTFVFPGRNDIQRFDFSNEPNDGTITFRHKLADSLNFPWDDSAADLKIALEAMPTITSVDITGEFNQGFFQIEFTGNFLADGLQEQPEIQVVQTDLDRDGVSTNVNGTTIVPVLATRVQEGKKAASNLFFGTSPINITVTDLAQGEQPGPDRLMHINSERIQINGLGKVENFEEGFVFNANTTKFKFDGYFENVNRPLLTLDKIPGTDTDIEAMGYAKDIFAQLRLVQHPTNPKRVRITGADALLSSGIMLSQSIQNLLMTFEGAEIDFGTALISVFESDGLTPLGDDLVRPFIAPGQWRWFSIGLIPSSLTPDNTTAAKVQIIAGSSDGITPEEAVKPATGANPVGMVAIRGALGDKEVTNITTVRDTFNSLKGKTLTLYHPNESVAFWVKDESLDTLSIEASTNVVSTNQDLFNSVTNTVFAGRIDVVGATIIDKVNIYLKRNGSPSGTFTLRVLGESGGLPDVNNILAEITTPINVSNVPTNFVAPVQLELDNGFNAAPGIYFVEINTENVITSGGNFLGWNSDDNGVETRIFNRDAANNTWLSDLGNRTANIDFVRTFRGIPTIAQLADREVEVETILENDFQVDVAQKFAAVIDNDPLFNATVLTNKITVENSLLGDVTDADMGDTGFFSDVLTQGADTDLTGIDDIDNTYIRQFTAGSGGAGGATGRQEKLGTGNGNQTNFPIISGFLPTNENSILVFTGTHREITTEWNYNSLQNQIEFVTAPELGEEVYIFYLTGGQSINVPTPSGTLNVPYLEVTALDITNKEIVMPSIPAEPLKVLVDIVGGTSQQYGVDFQISGNILSWDGLLLENIIEVGSVIRLFYYN